MKKWCFLLLIITFSLTVSAETEDFFLKTEKDTVTIGLNIKDFQMVQLFRKENEKSPVNIFEFSAPGSTFSENADSDNCYFIKVYKNSETPFVSEEKCVSETYFIGRIETALIIFLILLVFSFFAPRFIPFRFLTYETDKPEKTISETIKILAGEDSKSVLIHSSSDWIGDPVNIAVSSFLNRSLDEGQENVMTTYFNDLTFVRSDREKLFKKVLLINGQRPFLTSIIRNAVPRSAIFHITENNPESSLDSFKDRKEKRKIVFSSMLSGAVTDLLLKRNALISIESLIFDSREDEKRASEHSGAYLFLVVVASAVLLGSVLKTLGIERLVESIISLFAGVQ